MVRKVFDIDYTKGTLLYDDINSINVFTNFRYVKKKGVYCITSKTGSGTSSTSLTSKINSGSKYTIGLNINNMSSNQQLFLVTNSGNIGFTINLTALYIYINGSLIVNYIYALRGLTSYFIYIDLTQNNFRNQIKLYINGVLQTSSFVNTVPLTISGFTGALYMPNISTPGGPKAYIDVYSCFLYEGIRTDITPLQYYNKLINPIPQIIISPYKNLLIKNPETLQEDGLIAAYDFVNGEQGNIVLNLAKGNNNGFNSSQYNITKVGWWCQTKQGIRLAYKAATNNNYRLRFTNTMNLGKVHTLCFRYNQIDANTGIAAFLRNTAENIGIYGGYQNIYYINVVGFVNTISLTSSVPNNTMSSVVIVRNHLSIKIYCNNILIGNSTLADDSDLIVNHLYTMFGGNTIINNVKLYNKVLSIKQIKAYHNQFASQIIFYENFKSYVVGSRHPNYMRLANKTNYEYIIGETLNQKYLYSNGSADSAINIRQNAYGKTVIFDTYLNLLTTSQIHYFYVSRSLNSLTNTSGINIENISGVLQISIFVSNIGRVISTIIPSSFLNKRHLIKLIWNLNNILDCYIDNIKIINGSINNFGGTNSNCIGFQLLGPILGKTNKIYSIKVLDGIVIP